MSSGTRRISTLFMPAIVVGLMLPAAALAPPGSWSSVSSPAYWGGAARKSSTAGAKASLTFSGRSIAWIARTGPDSGKAQIYVNGTQR